MINLEKASMLGQCVAMRNVLDGIIASLQENPDTPGAADCEHPLDQRKYEKGAMGGPKRFLCQQCGETVNEPLAGV